MKDLQKHQVNALFGLGGTIFGFLLTYSLLSYSVSKRTEISYVTGLEEGYCKGRRVGYKLGYKQGFNTCYDEVRTNKDSISVKLTTLRILLDN